MPTEPLPTKMSAEVADEIRRICYYVGGGFEIWLGLAKHHPRFSKAIAELPNTESLSTCNIMLQEIFIDIHKRAIRNLRSKNAKTKCKSNPKTA